MAEVLVEGRDERDAELPLAGLAARLVKSAGKGGALFVARSERRASLIARALRELAPSLEVLRFPAWDCVPYDRASPSRFVMGRRIATLRRLAAGVDTGFIVVATPEALAQRVPPRALWPAAELRIKVGDALDVEALEKFLLRTGYVLDERVDEAGEAAIRGAVIDVFPAGGEEPVRLDHAEGRITGIRRYDAASQRTLAEEPEILLLPTSEAVLQAAETGTAGRSSDLPGSSTFWRILLRRWRRCSTISHAPRLSSKIARRSGIPGFGMRWRTPTRRGWRDRGTAGAHRRGPQRSICTRRNGHGGLRRRSPSRSIWREQRRLPPRRMPAGRRPARWALAKWSSGPATRSSTSSTAWRGSPASRRWRRAASRRMRWCWNSPARPSSWCRRKTSQKSGATAARRKR